MPIMTVKFLQSTDDTQKDEARQQKDDTKIERNRLWKLAGVRMNMGNTETESKMYHSDASACTFSSSSSFWESVSASNTSG